MTTKGTISVEEYQLLNIDIGGIAKFYNEFLRFLGESNSVTQDALASLFISSLYNCFRSKGATAADLDKFEKDILGMAQKYLGPISTSQQKELFAIMR